MFPCSGCGLCCKNISCVKELKDFDMGNGVCKFFDDTNNSCKIYETRPDICKVDYMFDTKFYKYYSKEEFYLLNANICNKLQEKFNFDTKFRLQIGG